MLVQFSVKNYKTFAEEAKLSMIASNYYTEKEADNIIEVPEFGLKLLKSAVIYGANASGKSKLFEAMAFVKKLIISSHGNLIGDSIGVEPFRLSTETENEPSVFEFIFIHKKQIYRYGFEATTEKIVAEWLYRRVKTKETELFYRDNQDFELNIAIFPVDDLVARKRIGPNNLLLSVAANGNDSIAVEVLEWIRGGCNILSGLQEQNYMGYSIRKLKDPKLKNQILHLMQSADLSIDDLIPKILKISDLPDGIPDELKEALAKKIEEKNDDTFSGVSTFHKK